jgi:hypothetical protein
MPIDPATLTAAIEEPATAASNLASAAGQAAVALQNARRNLKAVADLLAAAEKTIAERDAEIASLKAPRISDDDTKKSPTAPRDDVKGSK